MFEFIQLLLKLIGYLFVLLILVNAIVYLLSFYLGYKIIEWFGYTAEESLKLFMISIVISSIISFILCLIIFLLCKWKNRESKNFKAVFTLSYLINTYIWGLLSLIGLLKPFLIQQNVFIETDFLDQAQLSSFGILFFISLTNYTLFKNLIFDGVFRDLYNMIMRFTKRTQ